MARKPDPNATQRDGYHSFQNDDGEEYGSFEVTWLDEGGDHGWYWAACFPGCLPDGEWRGPFRTSSLAYRDARSD